MREEDVLNKAIRVFQRNTGLNIRVIANQPYDLNNVNYRWDAFVEIEWKEWTFEFVVEVKNVINRAVLGILMDRFQMIQKRGIVVAQYINPNLAQVLREKNIQFMDEAGNAFINEPPLFVFITGRKLDVAIKLNTLNQTFNPTGLQVVYRLLCNPGLINKTYRKIAIDANVALGTVNKILVELKKTGYLIENVNNQRQLIRKKELFERWVTEYPHQLRPKLLLGRFQAQTANWWMNQDTRKYGAYWGAEIAAQKLTNYLQPHKATIYTEKINPELILRNRLKKDQNGNVEILKRFWAEDPNNLKEETVHPILVYADLMALAESRAVETARIIYETRIAELVGKD